MYFSIIIPVFNRPDEVDELLLSLTNQTKQQFEVIIVEDGSARKSDWVVQKYENRLPLRYIYKANSGPGLSRNEGARHAKYDYLLFFDSDCIIPPHYMEAVDARLSKKYVDAYGGSDRAHSSFTTIQKAINYSMTSFFTTGGIRGGKKSMDRFHPRSFNLGVSKKAFESLNGYGSMRFGEDVDFSLRLIEKGFQTDLIAEAYVFHKRRTNFEQFFKQVHNSGIARINLYLAHPESLKIVHFLPALFVLGMTAVTVASFFLPILFLIPVFYSLAVFGDSLRQNSSFGVALYSIGAAWVQLFGYGTGFLLAFWRRLIRKEKEFKAFEKKFYD